MTLDKTHVLSEPPFPNMGHFRVGEHVLVKVLFRPYLWFSVCVTSSPSRVCAVGL